MVGIIMKIKIKFEPRDIWIGVYWTYEETMLEHNRSYYKSIYEYREKVKKEWTIYLCIVPMFPIIMRFSKEITQGWHD